MYKRPRSEKQHIIDKARHKWMSDPQKHKAVQRQAERLQLSDGRWKTLIRCACCEELFRRDEIEANHINPVGSLESVAIEHVRAYRERMFCKASGLEALCEPCHHAKTAAQRKAKCFMH